MIRAFIGYDSREAIAFHVLSHSIHSRSSEPVTVSPLMLSELTNIFSREAHPLQSTEFSFSRFLVPYLSGYKGWSLFCDCDMLMLDDIANLWSLRDDSYAVQVVKHDHKPKEEKKFLDQPQSKYEKKNWSSVILFNNERCTALTTDYVNTATGLELHQFKWLQNDALIGGLPAGWNHLVDYDANLPEEELSLIHFTEGGPYFDDYKNCSYANLWFTERDAMTYAGRNHC
ncbi:MAG: glycosyltransferase [Rhodospirillaceae bacterium]|jgi:lipopolysaccharide biosynthesis glycosyltransferase|nr:glycosyltransferase [Rhodospirillaceae bacterium]MBT6088060.1 glycosyltransferase [Rhodospirillaceae bacterium]